MLSSLLHCGLHHLNRATKINTNPYTTDAPTITTVVTESDALSVVQLRVAKLEKDVFELKKIDLSAEALADLKTQVPSIVDNYLRSKVRDVWYGYVTKRTKTKPKQTKPGTGMERA
ncbi:hypothetical protein Tco_0551878 [Tanacetum coccineum]